MKRIMLCCSLFVGMLVYAGLSYAQAPPTQLQWKGIPQAVDYRVFHSTDVGRTWQVAAIVPQPVPFPADSQIKGTVPLPSPLPEHGLVLYRASWRNAQQEEEIRFDAGAWRNVMWWMPQASNLGIP